MARKTQRAIDAMAEFRETQKAYETVHKLIMEEGWTLQAFIHPLFAKTCYVYVKEGEKTHAVRRKSGDREWKFVLASNNSLDVVYTDDGRLAKKENITVTQD